MLWTREFTLDDLNLLGRDTAAERCGVRFETVGDDWLEATMPLDFRTKGMDGAMHPGALAILAETIGSVAATLCIDNRQRICVGQILHVNHSAPITTGPVRAKASAVSILEDGHVWNVEMTDPTRLTVCVARLAMAVLDRGEFKSKF
jgi:1,4-dihydroxy-2-naphthoyl-CoA hydrolase